MRKLDESCQLSQNITTYIQNQRRERDCVGFDHQRALLAAIGCVHIISIMLHVHSTFSNEQKNVLFIKKAYLRPRFKDLKG